MRADGGGHEGDGWGAAAAVAELADAPIAVLSSEIRIVAVNAPFERIVGWGFAALRDRRWVDVLTPWARAETACRSLSAASEGLIGSLDVDVVSMTGQELTLSVEIRRFSRRAERGVVVAVRSAKPAEPAHGPSARSYLVQYHEGRTILRAPLVETGGEAGGAECYRALYGQSVPCPECPLRPQWDRPRTVVRFGGCAEPSLEIASARLLAVDLAEVTVVSIEESTLGAIREVRLRCLAEQCGLSDREYTVLAQLALLGQCPEGVAAQLRITERTVKFHLYNALKKVRAESIVDLLQRLL